MDSISRAQLGSPYRKSKICPGMKISNQLRKDLDCQRWPRKLLPICPPTRSISSLLQNQSKKESSILTFEPWNPDRYHTADGSPWHAESVHSISPFTDSQARSRRIYPWLSSLLSPTTFHRGSTSNQRLPLPTPAITFFSSLNASAFYLSTHATLLPHIWNHGMHIQRICLSPCCAMKTLLSMQLPLARF